MRLGRRGQTSLEYILVMSVVVTLAIIAFKTLRPQLTQLFDQRVKAIEEQFFKAGGFHRLPVRR